MAHFERRIAEIKQQLEIADMREFLMKSVEHYSFKLSWHRIPIDAVTKEAFDSVMSDTTPYNLHMYAHHVLWQFLEAYDSGKYGSMQDVCPKAIAKYRSATADCLYGQNS
jgi:hypothetical protein